MAPVSSSYMGRMVPVARSLRRRPANDPRSGLHPRARAEAKVSPSSLALLPPLLLLLPKATNRAEVEEEEEAATEGTEWTGATNALADPMDDVARPVRARMATAVLGYIIFGSLSLTCLVSARYWYTDGGEKLPGSKNSQVYPQGKLYPRKEKEEKEGKGSEMIKASLLGESTCNYR